MSQHTKEHGMGIEDGCCRSDGSYTAGPKAKSDFMAESFILFGLDNNNRKNWIPHFTDDSKRLKPIVDIIVVKSDEVCPYGYTIIDKTVGGHELTKKNLFNQKKTSSYLCFRTGTDKSPIIDIKLVYFHERPPKGFTLVTKSVEGDDGCVNGRGGQDCSLYVAYKRAVKAVNYAIVDMCVVRTGKELFPHTYYKVYPSLLVGFFSSSCVQLLYKISKIRFPRLSYRGEILFQYPSFYDSEQLPDLKTLSKFCIPDGIVFDFVHFNEVPTVEYFTTCLVPDQNRKTYCASYIFYEVVENDSVPEELKNEILEMKETNPNMVLYTSKVLCLLSKLPYFDLFHQFLSTLYRFTLSEKQSFPVERFLVYFMKFITKPTVQRPRIMLNFSLSQTEIVLNPFTGKIPDTGASFIKLIHLFEVDELMSLLLHMLLEQKIVVHSYRVSRILPIAESLLMMIYPFEWQCPCIPFCPLDLCEILHAPMSYLIGFSTDYFDFDIPADDVTCIDLANDHIKFGNGVNVKLPEVSEVLRSNLEVLKETLNIEISQNENFIETLDNRSKYFWELSIHYEFIRFVSLLMVDYMKFIKPYSPCVNDDTFNIDAIFNSQSFINSKNMEDRPFFNQMTKTQYFSYFIAQCSIHTKIEGLSVTNVHFLNEFIDQFKRNENKKELQKKITQIDDNPVVVFPSILSFTCDYGKDFVYRSVEKFDFDLLKAEEVLLLKSSDMGESEQVFSSTTDNEFGLHQLEYDVLAEILIRSKAEKHKSANHYKDSFLNNNLLNWSETLENGVYACWFICLLPAYFYCDEIHGDNMQNYINGQFLRYALHVFDKISKSKTLPNVCVRVLIMLASYSKSRLIMLELYKYLKNKEVYMNDSTLELFNKLLKSIDKKTHYRVSSLKSYDDRSLSCENGNDTVNFKPVFSLRNKNNKHLQPLSPLIPKTHSISGCQDYSDCENVSNKSKDRNYLMPQINKTLQNDKCIKNNEKSSFIVKYTILEKINENSMNKKNFKTDANSNPIKLLRKKPYISKSTPIELCANTNTPIANTYCKREHTVNLKTLNIPDWNTIHSEAKKIEVDFEPKFRLYDAKEWIVSLTQNAYTTHKFLSQSEVSDKFVNTGINNRGSSENFSCKAFLDSEDYKKRNSMSFFDQKQSFSDPDSCIIVHTKTEINTACKISADKEFTESTFVADTHTKSNLAAGNSTDNNYVSENFTGNSTDNNHVSKNFTGNSTDNNYVSENFTGNSTDNNYVPENFTGNCTDNKITACNFTGDSTNNSCVADVNLGGGKSIVDKRLDDKKEWSWVKSGKRFSVHMSCCKACQKCGGVLSDEDIVSGWNYQTSNFTLKCTYCKNSDEQIAKLKIIVFEHKETREKNMNGSNEERILISTTEVVYMSPIVLLEQLEHSIELNGIEVLYSVDFPEQHSIIYWNLLWFFWRKQLSTHLCLLLAANLGDVTLNKIKLTASWHDDPTQMSKFKPLKYLYHTHDMVPKVPQPIISNIHKIVEFAYIKQYKLLVGLFLDVMIEQYNDKTPIIWNLYKEAIHLLVLIETPKSALDKFSVKYKKRLPKLIHLYPELRIHLEMSTYDAAIMSKYIGPLYIQPPHAWVFSYLRSLD